MLPDFCAVKKLQNFPANMPVVSVGDLAAVVSEAAICTCSPGRCVRQPEGERASDLAV